MKNGKKFILVINVSIIFILGGIFGRIFDSGNQGVNSHERPEMANPPFLSSGDILRLKCLNCDRKVRTTTEIDSIYENIYWRPQKDGLQKKAKFLSEDLLEITVSDRRDSYTGRKILYQVSKDENYLRLIGGFSEYYRLKHSEPDTYLVKGTNWIVSEEVSASGTGLSERWGRYWLLNNKILNEELAIPVYGTQQMSTEDPVRSYKIVTIPEKCNDDRIYFSIHATCKVFYGDGESESLDLIELLLKDINEAICFKKDYRTGKFLFDESISTISISKFHSITNLEMKFDNEFFDLYGSELIKLREGPSKNSVMMWLKYCSISSAIRENSNWKVLFAK